MTSFLAVNDRLAITRALYLDRKIIVLDEATNALDIKTEEKILKIKFTNLKDKIIINISHKINEMINYQSFGFWIIIELLIKDLIKI